jgi:hypothetical protein
MLALLASSVSYGHLPNASALRARVGRFCCGAIRNANVKKS